MTFLEIVGAAGIGGIISFATILLAIGKKLQIIEDLRDSFKDELKPSIQKIEKDFTDLKERFVITEDRVETIWKDRLAPSRSPRQLNDQGSIILEESGIKEILHAHKPMIVEQVRSLGLTSAYDAEKAIEDVVAQLPIFAPDTLPLLKEGSFKTGTELNALLFVGAIYLRDEILAELGFSE